MEAGKRILIIDDEEDFLQLMGFLLESAHFIVIRANSPEEGLEKAKLAPDLILLDLSMPRMTGHDVCRKLKHDEATRNIPVIMLTSLDRTIDKVEAFGLGVVDYINKQAHFEEISARIKSVLRQASPQESSKVVDARNEKIIALRKVIEEKALKTLYQPIVSLINRQAMGYEALTRGPKGTFLESPLDLFALAIEADMVFELEKTCMNLSIQRGAFIKPGQLLFLNIDPLVINAGYIREAISFAGSSLAPSQICIEITERTCMKNFEKLANELSHFRSLGANVAIDDAGEGYSSLNAIAELKPEFIKVNMNLVRNVNTDIVKNSLITVMVDLGKRLDCNLIAEGIETEEEFRVLFDMGIRYGQGYLFAVPTEHVIV